MMRTPTTALLRSAARATRATPVRVQRAAATTHAISNPTLANIEKRWEGMPHTEQAELWMQLRDRMKEDWAQLTVQEKKAAYWIAFGSHGPRAEAPPGEGQKVALYTAVGVFVSFAIFATMRMFAGPAPSTMTREYQEASDEFLKNQNAEPLTGISAEGAGPSASMVQSPPKQH